MVDVRPIGGRGCVFGITVGTSISASRTCLEVGLCAVGVDRDLSIPREPINKMCILFSFDYKRYLTLYQTIYILNGPEREGF